MKTTVSSYTALAICNRVPSSYTLPRKRSTHCRNKAVWDRLQLLLGIKHIGSCEITKIRSLQPQAVLGGMLPFSNLNFKKDPK